MNLRAIGMTIAVWWCLAGCSAAGSGSEPTCGNGIVEGSENCDSTEVTTGWGCSETCTWLRCGDGILSAWESCDDGNRNDGDACASDCTTCGDGIKQWTEICDDGNDIPGDGCYKCKKSDEAFVYSISQLPARPLALDSQERLYGDKGGVVRFSLDSTLQQYWRDISVGEFTASGGSRIHISSDDSIWVSETYGGPYVCDGMDSFVARLDPAGSILWNSKLPKPQKNDEMYTSFINVSGSNLVFAGLYNETAGMYCDGITNYAQVSLYDLKGTLKWSKQYRESAQQTSASALAVAADRICIIEAIESMTSWREGLDDYRYALSCYDLTGNQTWARAVGEAAITSMRVDDGAGTISAYSLGSWWTYGLESGEAGAVGSIDIPALDSGKTAIASDLIVVLGLTGSNLWISVHDLAGSRLWEAAPRSASQAPEFVGMSSDGTLYCTAWNASSEELLVYETGLKPAPTSAP